MSAVFHAHRADGTILATSESHPDWSLVTSGSLHESVRRAEASLRAYLQQKTFTHYEIPAAANSELRSAA